MTEGGWAELPDKLAKLLELLRRLKREALGSLRSPPRCALPSVRILRLLVRAKLYEYPYRLHEPLHHLRE